LCRGTPGYYPDGTGNKMNTSDEAVHVLSLAFVVYLYIFVLFMDCHESIVFWINVDVVEETGQHDHLALRSISLVIKQ
jgi:hypothetical protein